MPCTVVTKLIARTPGSCSCVASRALEIHVFEGRWSKGKAGDPRHRRCQCRDRLPRATQADPVPTLGSHGGSDGARVTCRLEETLRFGTFDLCDVDAHHRP